MPPKEMITKGYLKQILKGQKKLFKLQDVRFVNSPNYDEVGVKALCAKIVENPQIQLYFPDSFPKGRQCDKQYMYNVWNTIEPEEVEAVIKHANRQRYT